MGYVVEMLNIRKEFPGIVANDDITLKVSKGEVHALLGENGAGKSTLMGMLFGMYTPDKGIIKIKGSKVKISNPNVANDLGIGMVHQHFKLVDNFTVAENIILGLEPKKGLIIDEKLANEKVRLLSQRYGLNVDPNEKIENISVGMQQRVEILKMLYRNADILILDEPTAVLTPQEIIELIEITRNLVKGGKSIILITHKLKEIKLVADKCTVMRRGKYIGTVEVDKTTESEMARMMVGREVKLEVEKKTALVGNNVMKINRIDVKNNKNILGLKKFTLDINEGEILGIAGVEGNGQSELVEAITGLRKIESGTIEFNGEIINNKSIKERIELGIAYIPEDRQKRGLILDYSLKENMILKVYHKKPYSKNGLLNEQEIKDYSDKIIKLFDIRSSEGSNSITRSMSGGNQQKVIIGREIELNPKLLIAAQPTRGLDVGAIEYIHKRLIEERDKGKAVLLVSLELDEVLNLSDRIAIINNGQLIGIVEGKGADEKEIGLMMTGIKRGERFAEE